MAVPLISLVFQTHLCMLVKMAATSYVGLHLFCKISRQSSPVPYTLGWNIWLMNFTPGGLLGYCSSKCMTNLNVPSSNGVSTGPIMTAFLHFVSLATYNVAEPPDIPGHNIVCNWRCRDTSRRVCLHALGKVSRFFIASPFNCHTHLRYVREQEEAHLKISH